MADNKETREVEILLNAQQANASIKDMAAGVALMNNQLAKMSQDDPRREQLKKDFQELKERVKAARDEINSVVSAEEQQRLASEKLAAQAAQLNQVNAETLAGGQKLTASYREMKQAAALMEQQLEELSADDPGRQQLIDDFQTLKTRMSEAKAGFAASSQAAEELRQRELALAEATRQQAEEQAQATKQTLASGQQATASFNEMKAAASVLEKQLHEVSADDPGRAALIRDYQLLQQRIKAAKAEADTYVKTEEELRAEAEQLNQENAQVILNGQRVAATFNEMDKAAKQLEAELKDLSADDPGRKKMLADYQALQERIEGVKKEMGSAKEEAGFFRKALMFTGVNMGVEALVGQVEEIGKSIFETTAKFETYGTIMENALGSKSLAQKALADLQKMAASTPFSVDELTSSFLKFVNRGLQPTMAEMTKLGDLASSQGKSFDQLTEAVLDAAGGEFERLKEFGIKASKSGDQVELSFKGVNQTVANTPEAIQGAILAMGEMKGVAGGMAAIAASLDGQLSNLGDTADQTAIEWGQTLRPAFVAVLTTLGFLLGMLKAVPSLLKENRGVLLALGGALVTLNAEMVTWNLMLLEEAVRTKAGLVWKAASTTATNLMTFSWQGLNAAMKANPIGFVIGLVMLLVGAFVTAYEKSEKFRAVLNGLGAGFMALVRIIRDEVVAAWDVVAGLFDQDAARVQKGLDKMAATHKEAGEKMAKAYHDGYDEESTKRDHEANVAYEQKRQQFAQRIKDALEKRLKAEAEAEKAGLLEKLKNEEAALRQKLAKVQEGSEAEMRLKQQLVTNEAAQQLANEKKTAAERAIIEAEAEQKRVKLAQEFYEKRAKAAKAARDKADQEHLNDLKKSIKEEGDLLDTRNALNEQRDKTHWSDEARRREQQHQAIIADAEKKYKELVLLEGDHTQEILALVEERDLKLRELQKGFDEKDEKERQEKLDEKIKLNQAETEVTLSELELKLASGKLTQEEYDEAVYKTKQASMDRELALIKEKNGKESAEYKNLLADKNKAEAAHEAKTKGMSAEFMKFKRGVGKVEEALNSDAVKYLEDSLGKQTILYKAFKAARKLAAIAEIEMNLVQEIQSYWKNSANFGPAGYIWASIQSGVAAIRAGVAVNQIEGFAKGGATGEGMDARHPAVGGFLNLVGTAMGLGIGTSGKLVDSDGLEVAGIVHRDEYVIPAWMREDPQVLQVENWLEARRQRGFYEGGPTTQGDTRAQGLVPGTAEAGADRQQLIQVLASLDQRLQQVEQWPTQLDVVLDLLQLDREQKKLAKVQNGSAVRPSEK